MNTPDIKRYFLLILILGLVTALSPFSIDMYLPAFPAIAADLHCPVSRVQLSLTSYFIGIALGQLIYGPLLDRFGRKKPLYIGLCIYVLASLGCSVTRSANMLIGMRLLQALGSCGGMVAARALVRDLFPVNEIAKVFSLLLLVIAVSPLLAPTIGSYVSAALGWHAVFIILTAISVFILLASWFWLPEGRGPNIEHSLKPKPIIESFYSVFKHPQFYTYAITGGIASASQYAYLSGSSDVFIDVFHFSQHQYGWTFACIAAGLIGCSQINSLFLRYFTSRQIIKVAQAMQCLIGVTLFALTYYGIINAAGMIALIFLFLSAQGFISPNASALSLTPFPHNAGTASALMGTLQMGIGAFASAMVSVLNNGTALPMTGIMAVCTVCALLLLFIGGSRLTKTETATGYPDTVKMPLEH
ncbi:Bcr/CflA family drug resistance efflux transporter [Mucilaginibacter sp. PPCGB 2223]|uniref:multidrug effflux MFS transporter n=1 Tax=Mucilaginibacter sp. PPCGB 2223 TaxID=1886027 RepID=UPI0008260D4C|nr:multidrug effflux MFS transporter [Mucilaginibacter sp. PPCGB 2223]OCX51448.1 Bcr/CflA family drug resistance efflux transporter [Mucilaginibacter sp. PPCGB 2223]